MHSDPVIVYIFMVASILLAGIIPELRTRSVIMCKEHEEKEAVEKPYGEPEQQNLWPLSC